MVRAVPISRSSWNGVGEGDLLLAGVVGEEVPRLRGWESEVLILQFFLEW